ncbi:MAG: hypothetical protein R3B40_18445 [Polyangiales bacterium]
MSDTPEHVITLLEPLAARFGRDELDALWRVIDAFRVSDPALPAHQQAALARAQELQVYADQSNECPPGFPRDDPGPWHWACLSSLTKAAALASSDPALALHYVRCAEREAAHIR